jgi:protein gp37
MGLRTAIQWCDSTCNIQMGCDGCELWNPPAGVLNCYAGEMTGRLAGQPGYPAAFDRPELFLHRFDEALRWPGLTGRGRPVKPWLDGLPRLIFLDDMGDTFTESLPDDWLPPLLPRLADSPHVWIILTKRARRMAAFFGRYTCPANVWPLVSVTSAAAWGRVEALRGIAGAAVLGVSLEPQLAPLEALAEPGALAGLGWLIVGGESGLRARPFDLAWARAAVAAARRDGCPCFVKQLGARPRDGDAPMRLRDGHGGDWSEWPADLRVREVPRGRA